MRWNGGLKLHGLEGLRGTEHGQACLRPIRRAHIHRGDRDHCSVSIRSLTITVVLVQFPPLPFCSWCVTVRQGLSRLSMLPCHRCCRLKYGRGLSCLGSSLPCHCRYLLLPFSKAYQFRSFTPSILTQFPTRCHTFRYGFASPSHRKIFGGCL